MDKDPPDLRPSFSPCKWDAATFLHGQLTDRIIACAIEVHRELGPGFLEALYEEAFCAELDRQGLKYRRQLPVPIRYKNLPIGTHRLDVVVDEKIVVELKAIKAIEDVHLAVMISYLRASRIPIGLIVNFAATKVRVRRLWRDPPPRRQGDQEAGGLEDDD